MNKNQDTRHDVNPESGDSNDNSEHIVNYPDDTTEEKPTRSAVFGRSQHETSTVFIATGLCLAIALVIAAGLVMLMSLNASDANSELIYGPHGPDVVEPGESLDVENADPGDVSSDESTEDEEDTEPGDTVFDDGERVDDFDDSEESE